jgi:hypothetical protein
MRKWQQRERSQARGRDKWAWHGNQIESNGAKTRGFKTFCIKYSDVTTWSLSIDYNLWLTIKIYETRPTWPSIAKRWALDKKSEESVLGPWPLRHAKGARAEEEEEGRGARG